MSLVSRFLVDSMPRMREILEGIHIFHSEDSDDAEFCAYEIISKVTGMTLAQARHTYQAAGFEEDHMIKREDVMFFVASLPGPKAAIAREILNGLALCNVADQIFANAQRLLQQPARRTPRLMRMRPRRSLRFSR